MVVADRLRRHLGRKDFSRKRRRKEAFRPINFTDRIDEGSAADNLKKARTEPSEAGSDLIVKPVVQPMNGLVGAIEPTKNPLMTLALPKLELSERPNDSCNEASKLTSEVAFWLRHLTIPMARTLTTSSFAKDGFNGTTPGIPVAVTRPTVHLKNDASCIEDDSDLSGEASDEDVVQGRVEDLALSEMAPSSMAAWPGIDTIMVLYMASQQGTVPVCVLNSVSLSCIISN